MSFFLKIKIAISNTYRLSYISGGSRKTEESKESKERKRNKWRENQEEKEGKSEIKRGFERIVIR